MYLIRQTKNIYIQTAKDKKNLCVIQISINNNPGLYKTYVINNLNQKTGTLTSFLPNSNGSHRKLFQVHLINSLWNGSFFGYVSEDNIPDQLHFYKNNLREGESIELDF